MRESRARRDAVCGARDARDAARGERYDARADRIRSRARVRGDGRFGGDRTTRARAFLGFERGVNLGRGARGPPRDGSRTVESRTAPVRVVDARARRRDVVLI